MGLTSPVLPYLLGMLAAVLLVGIVVGWPRLARFGAWQVGLRVLSLCLLQACVLALIFVVVNRSNSFYSSWSELFGSEKGAASVVAAEGGGVSSQQQLVITGRTDVHVRGDFAAGGTLQSIALHGQLSGLSAAGHVYLPAGYQAKSARPYPVLIVIADTASSSSSAYAATRLAQSAAVEIAAHRMPPVVLVMLPATLASADRACLNVPPVTAPAARAMPAVQGQTFFAEDVPGILQASYDVSSYPGNWALLGDQSGGYCALQLALDTSYVFPVAVVPRGNYSQPPGIGAALSGSQFQQQDSLIWQLSHLPMQPVTVLFAGPGRDQAAGPVQPFLSLAHLPMRVSLTQLGTGSWPLGNVLDWIGAAVTTHAQQG